MSILKDISYMKMAYALAEKARGRASPNPLVGAVIVKNNLILGYGYHEGPGHPHAEAMALKRAGNQAKGSTLYVTLEPCVHWGRTPPCVDGITRSGIKKVVVSALDPNPLVYKKGIRKIKEAGINVSNGLLEDKNSSLNEAYIKYMKKKVPFVTLKAAVSLDGKMATRKFDSRWISSDKSREYSHLLRGEHDALLVGSNTLLKDDPRLTVRHRNWKGKKILRLILDSCLRFPLEARIISTLKKGKIIVFTTEKASKQKANSLRQKGVEIISLASSCGRVELKKVLAFLGEREITSLLVEGGGEVITSFIEKKLADKIFLFISPRFIGGKDAPSLFQAESVSQLKEAYGLKKIKCFRLEEDIIMEGYF
ncbi:MAG: bifunctional diaminohydroxyphosphoribosylaminopyrimidine deaminase/5-amino-6-(5-phosphoribosylamino)uracil reductase RibD [Candidatus Aminicenantales bacterium]